MGRIAQQMQRLQEERLALWNQFCPPGTPVIVEEDDGRQTKTTTRSEAYLLGGHTAVVMLADRSGCFLLQRCRRQTALEMTGRYETCKAVR
jgi:hypothetical protein